MPQLMEERRDEARGEKHDNCGDHDRHDAVGPSGASRRSPPHTRPPRMAAGPGLERLRGGDR